MNRSPHLATPGLILWLLMLVACRLCWLVIATRKWCTERCVRWRRWPPCHAVDVHTAARPPSALWTRPRLPPWMPAAMKASAPMACSPHAPCEDLSYQVERLSAVRCPIVYAARTTVVWLCVRGCVCGRPYAAQVLRYGRRDSCDTCSTAAAAAAASQRRPCRTHGVLAVLTRHGPAARPCEPVAGQLG